MSTDVENELVSVERVDQYTQLTQEAPAILPAHRPPRTWPEKGEIEFDRVSLRYRQNLPLVLQNLSCHIKPHEKIGIVGRTGAGKCASFTSL